MPKCRDDPKNMINRTIYGPILSKCPGLQTDQDSKPTFKLQNASKRQKSYKKNPKNNRKNAKHEPEMSN